MRPAASVQGLSDRHCGVHRPHRRAGAGGLEARLRWPDRFRTHLLKVAVPIAGISGLTTFVSLARLNRGRWSAPNLDRLAPAGP